MIEDEGRRTKDENLPSFVVRRSSMYCELHCHTYYSLLDGASSPAALLDRAVALGMSALAITDHDGLIGAVEFWRAARRGVSGR